MPENTIQINISVSEEDVKMIDRMMTEDAFDNRSGFMRRLVRMEYARRYSQPNVAVTIEQAIEAGKEI